MKKLLLLSISLFFGLSSIKAQCDAPSAVSPLAFCGGGASIPIEATASAASLTYTLVMNDSWGDGWNGASIDVSVNGSVVANATIGTGSSGVATISTMNGDAVDFTFNSGSYDSEITFQITDPAGAVLGSYGPSPSTGSFLTHTSNSICNVHLSVNTASITVGPSGMYAGGGVLGDAMAVPLSDNDLDGTWEGFAVVPNAGGNYTGTGAQTAFAPTRFSQFETDLQFYFLKRNELLLQFF